MGKQCPGCGNEYKRLGSHLSKSDCDYPEFTDRQKEILKGMMLGDGWINHQSTIENAKPYFAVGMTNYEFLQWLDNEMKPHSTGVKDATGSQESKKPYYNVRTMRSPRLSDLAEWYDGGKLSLRQIELTPLSLKMWYVSDGWLHWKDDCNYPELRIGNRIANNREEYFNNLFSEIDVSPRVYDDEIYFNTTDAKKLIDYMGDPVPGFEEKWPDPTAKAEEDESQTELV